MQKINFKNKPSTNSPINADNLNLLQDNVEDAINEVDLKGGELIAYGIITSTGTGTEIPREQQEAISSNQFPNKTANIVNYVDGVLEFSSGAFRILKTSMVSLVEVETSITGAIGSGCVGISWFNNANELPDGITFMKGTNSRFITSINGSYGGNSNTSIYKVNTEMDTSFYANPTFSPYLGSITPNGGGLSCYQIIKIYAKKRN